MKKFLIFFCLSAVSGIVSAELKTPRPEISVQNYNEVNANRPVLLRDLATFSFAAPTQIRKAMALVVFDAIGDSEKVEYKNSEIVKTIKEKINEDSELSDLKWTYFVPEKVTVIGRKNYLSELSAISEMTLAMQSKCSDCKIQFKDVKIPHIREKLAYESCSLDSEQIRGGSFLVPVNCQFNNEKKTYWITGTVRISKSGPVAARQINSGEKISAQDVRIEQVDLTYAKDSVPTIEEVQNQIAARGILVNQPIFRGDLKKELAVTRGQIIRAVSGNESFEVTSQVQAEEQGYVGDLIKIKNTETHRVISGQIVEKGVVRVQ